MMNFLKIVFLAMIVTLYVPLLAAQDWVDLDYIVTDDTDIVQLSFTQDVESPVITKLDAGVPRLVLDWPRMTSSITGQDIGQGQMSIAGEGVIKRFRYAAREEGLRLVLELTPNAVFSETESLGNQFRVKFKTQNRGQNNILTANYSSHDSFAYDAPIPRLKPTLVNLDASPAFTKPQEPAKPHDAFLYNVPLPRVKPSAIIDRAAETTQFASIDVKSQNDSAEIYTPKKRVFKASETPYPRTAPHIGAGQSLNLGRAKTALLRPVSKKPMIIIDPGHGGYDPGAIGAKGTKEKLITSRVSKRLAEGLRKTGRYNVALTRTKDVYVEHEDRLRIARERGADLFISLHADSTENGKAAGASVYTLADRAKGRSKNITHTQNWIVDVDLSEQTSSVGDILVDLAQRKTQSRSAEFAAELVSHLEPVVPLVRNTHRRAGYYVLLAPDVPAVLLELGFISNREDEKRLNKTAEQEKITKAVIRAINSYFNAKTP